MLNKIAEGISCYFINTVNYNFDNMLDCNRKKNEKNFLIFINPCDIDK